MNWNCYRRSQTRQRQLLLKAVQTTGHCYATCVFLSLDPGLDCNASAIQGKLLAVPASSGDANASLISSGSMLQGFAALPDWWKM